ncbi:helix-turn-helix domain-containing protein [Brachybacterium epidermidis]|uniref:helix-turn-helix domain-containing protein n=1 Tax=Brachybacterium epidermidis TaxID=2781983 RepID=UPI0032B7ED3F
MTLIRRILRGSRRSVSRPEGQPIQDVRGPVARNSPRPQTRLSVPNRAALAEQYAKGVPVDELARRFGVHRATVHRLAAQAGVSSRRRGLDEPGRRDAARLYEQGMTLEEVAAELGVGDETVRSAVVACGGTIRSRGRRRVSG